MVAESTTLLFKLVNWASPEDVRAAHKTTRRLIRDGFAKLEGLIMATQADVNALAGQVRDVGAQLVQGVGEVQTELERVAAELNVDLSPISDALAPVRQLADQLANDNIPAAPPVEPPVEEPPVEPVQP